MANERVSRIDIRVSRDLKSFLQVYAKISNTTVTQVFVDYATRLQEQATSDDVFMSKARSLTKPIME